MNTLGSGKVTAARISKTVGELRATFTRGVTQGPDWREKQLKALRRLISENSRIIEEAVKTDLGKPVIETRITELALIEREIKLALAGLKNWLKPRKAAVPAILKPARAVISPEPYGVVLIIAPWNYPVSLLLLPLVGAVAAGNTVLLKPSELTPNVARVLSTLIPRYAVADAVRITEADGDETALILAQRFDYIFYTGNPKVGKVIARAAAAFLTPVTLELGGKSPAWVGDNLDLKAAAGRLAWGKFINAGQTCVAPDYVLTTAKTAPLLLAELRTAITRMYGKNPRKSLDYGRIVNRRHFLRLQNFLRGREAVQLKIGGESEEKSLYIAPTVLDAVAMDDPIMREEIFGPILPIVIVKNFAEAVKLIKSREKPLVLYGFTDSAAEQKCLAGIAAGAVAFNVPAAHLMASELPFGGVGESGFGAYHGYYSFTAFSHFKPVFSKSLRFNTLRFIYPPYGYLQKLLLKLIRK